MQVRIRFKARGTDSVIGPYAVGDVARVDEARARLLIEQGIADYAPVIARATLHLPKKGRKDGAL